MSLEEAQAAILGDLAPVESEPVALDEAAGRVVAIAQVATRWLPLFDNAAKDGYAVRAADTMGTEVVLPVGATVPAGTHGSPLVPGSAARIFTGAPLPLGADAVVMQEDAHLQGGSVRLARRAPAGQDVRRRGEDMRPGAVYLPVGTHLGPGDVAAMAAQGHLQVQVHRRPRVAIVPTGDELVEPQVTPGPGQIVNANAPMLAAAVRAAGGVPKLWPAVRDTPHAIETALQQAAAAADLVLTCGGVSVGDYDFVGQALRRSGTLRLWKVAIKPGKPLAYARWHDTPLIGLPGNPVSAFVCFELFARPAIRRLSGAEQPLRAPRPVILGAALPANGARRQLLRARLQGLADGLPRALPHATQGSGQLSSLCAVDALLDVAAGAPAQPCGSHLLAYVLNPVL